jgi:FAD/FMN-containing dehydrogenase
MDLDRITILAPTGGNSHALPAAATSTVAPWGGRSHQERAVSQRLTDEEIARALARLPPHHRDIIKKSGIDVRKVVDRIDFSPRVLREGPTPADWPTGIPVGQMDFENWDEGIYIENVWVAKPASADDVVRIANWAAEHGFHVRPSGRSHNWSPMVIGDGDSVARTILVDTSGLTRMSFHPGEPATVTVGVGATLDDLINYLHDPHVIGPERPGDAAPGYAFRNMPAPGALSLGGILAIGGHGTSVSSSNQDSNLNGCLSNLVVSFTAVVTAPDDPSGYTLKTFERGNPDAAAFLVHLGRAFLVEATLQVIPDYWLRLENIFPDVDKLFAAEPGDQSLSSFVDQSGRVEVLWFPYTGNAWTKTWTLETTRPPDPSPPYYLPLVNDIPQWFSDVIACALQAAPYLTEPFCKGEAWSVELLCRLIRPLRGAASNLLRYVKDNTFRVAAGGYAVHTARTDVQYVVNKFYNGYQSCLQKSQGYPMNSAVEIRVTSTDTVAGLGIPGADPPALSATTPISDSFNTVVWIDALTINSRHYRNPYTNAFYADLEGQLLALWGPDGTDTERAVLRPEWSKGWGFTADQGAWTDQATIKGYLTTFPRYGWARDTLARYDKAGIFTDDLLSRAIFGESGVRGRSQSAR